MSDKKKESKKTEEELGKIKKETNEFRDKYLRALADYQNLEKRLNKEHELLKNNGKQEIILKLLPILDNLEKAEVFIKDGGLQSIKESFKQILKSENIEEINVLGKDFNPQLAEAVDVVAGDSDNKVVEVLRKGYRFGEKILRVAQVKVSKSQMSNLKSQNHI